MSAAVPCLWFDGRAEEAARFYCSLFPDSRVTAVVRAPADVTGARAGEAVLVEWTMDGRAYQGLNGGPGHPHSDAFSLSVPCATQAEVDRLWDALSADGGAPIYCGWLKDRWGVHWQIVPERLMAILREPDSPGRTRAFQAMSAMVKLDVAAIEAAYAGEPLAA